MWPFGSKPSVRELGVGDDEDFVDLTFHATEITARGGIITLPLAATRSGRRLGLTVEIEPSVRPGVVVEDIGLTLAPAIVRLTSRGAESDAFLEVLGSLFQIAPTQARMVPTLTLTALVLEGQLHPIRDAAVRIKLFHEVDPAHDEEQADYFEWYLNVHGPSQTVVLAEKDPDHREPIVRVLTAR